ncbi:MAG TPA: winged helix-turn-helix domain-containing protein, partial [Rhodopila sp.]
MRHRILVVGRDVEPRAHLARLLAANSYAVDIAESAAHARRIELRGIALSILISAGLETEARDLLDELQTATRGTVLVVGSHRFLDHASDVLDPFNEAGILARVRDSLGCATKVEEPARMLRFASYCLDLAGQSLINQTGQQVSLTRGEYRLLCEFVQRPGRVLSRDHLLQALSGRDAEAYDRSIDMLVVRLRRKIEADPKRPGLIIAIPGTGYKFAANVQQVDSTIAPVPQQSNGAPAPAERRQVTALSTELLPADGRSLAADPEDLQTLIDAYRRAALAVVTQHGGIVGHCVGSEVLAFFGHPVAEENSAERAIHAALDLARGLTGGSEMPSDLSIRAGLATGLVVAYPAGEVIGDATSEAARMRSLAEPGQVVVAASTHRLSGRLFAYRAIEPKTTGPPDPQISRQVLGATALATRS